MSFSLSVYAQIKDLARDLNTVEQRNLKFAFAKTLNKISSDAVGRLREESQRLFDRPVTYTVKGWGRKKVVDKRYPAAFDVFAFPQQAKYLAFQVYGGSRVPGDYATGSSRIVMPARATKLNQHGNIPKGYSDKLAEKPGFFQGVQSIGGRQIDGWWQRPKRGQRRDGSYGNLGFPLAVLLFGDRESYKPRLDMRGIVQRTINETARRHFKTAMAEAIASDRGF